MIYVDFENENGIVKNAFSDFGMVLSSHSVPSPEPKLYTVPIDGADGELDLSEWAGEVKYSPRTVECVFTCIGLSQITKPQIRAFEAFILGRVMKVTFSDEPEYYYRGRCVSIKPKKEKNITTLEVEFTCEPYKIAHLQTVISRVVTSSASIVLKAERKTVIPTITVNASTTLGWKGASYSVNAGTKQIPGIKVTDEANTLTVTGACNIQISWYEGVL